MTAQNHVEPPVENSWAMSVTAGLERSRRTAWIIACLATVTAILLAIAIVLLIPLKTVEPYTLLVDKHTGYVEAIEPLSEQVISSDAALTRSFLVQYIIAREGFSIDNVQQDYRKVSLFSSPEAFQRYARRMQINNPESPLAFMSAGGQISVVVRSVSSLSAKRSMVRFTTVRKDRGARPQEAQYWAAIIDWQYSNAAMSQDDRLINPLGFQVTRYRRNAETLPEVVDEQQKAVDSRKETVR